MAKTFRLTKDDMAYLADTKERVIATQDRRRSNATAAKLPMGSRNTRRNRTRADQRRIAIAASA